MLRVKSDKSDWFWSESIAIQNRNVVGPGQRSRFLVMTKRSAASGDENDSMQAFKVLHACVEQCNWRLLKLVLVMSVHSPLSHGGHIGYDVCTLSMKSRRCVSNLRLAANHAKQRSFQCALMCPCAQITDQKVH